MNFLKKYWPLFFLLLLTVIYSFPYLFQGKIPFPSSYVANNLTPWNKYFPHGPIKNGIPDVPGEIFPMRSLIIDFWKNGIVPLWNPYIFSGNPLLANFQSAVFFPGNLLFTFLAKVDAWSILVLLQPFLAAIFTYLLCRSLKLSIISSLFSGISFMFCGYLTVWGSYGTMGYAILFLPLALFLVEKYLQNNKAIFLPLITLVLAISFFSGHIQTWLYVFLATLIYIIVKYLTDSTSPVIARRDSSLSLRAKRSNLNDSSGQDPQSNKEIASPLAISEMCAMTHKTLLLLLVFIFLAIPLVALQFLPTWEFYQLSSRVLVKSNGFNVGIPLVYLITFLAPDFFGNPVTRNDWFGVYAEWSGYTGLVVLLLSIFATAIFYKKKTIWLFLAIGISGTLLSVQNPLLNFLVSLPIPILSNSNPSRAIVLLSFSMAILSGFGLEAIQTNWEKVKKKLFSILIIISIIFIMVIVFILLGKSFFTPDAVSSLRSISLRNLILPLGFLFIVWVLMLGLRIRPQLKKLIIICLLLTTALEMLRFYTKWTPFDAQTSFYKETPVTNFLSKNKNYYRFYGQFTQSTGYMHHILATDGYEPLNLLSYSQFLGAARSGQLRQDYQLEVKLQSQEKNTLRLLNILGVKYLVYGADDIRNPFVFPFWNYGTGNFLQIFTDGKFTIFENKWTLARPTLFNKYQVIADKRRALTVLLSNSFDYRHELILDSNPTLNISLGTGSAVMKKYTPNEVEMETQTDTPTLLFLSDNYYPGWQGFVNGKKTKILLADFTFRAIEVPAGNNLVVFRYEPESFKYGIIISGITLVLLMTFLLI